MSPYSVTIGHFIDTKMKAQLELVQPSINESFVIRYFERDEQQDKRYPWHYHEELEIVYVKGGDGSRYVGNHLSMYKDGDLVLIGSNVPHCGFVDGTTQNDLQVVTYIKKDLFNTTFFNLPESKGIKGLINLSNKGIAITGEDKDLIGAKLIRLSQMYGFPRLMLLLEILNDIGNSQHLQILNRNYQSIKTNLVNEQRISEIYNYIQRNFADKITVSEVAGSVDMSDAAFCRYFKKYTGKTFTNYLNEYRIMHACRLLRENNRSITDIAYLSGFSNFSYFNRVFKKSVNQSPSQYRKTIINL